MKHGQAITVRPVVGGWSVESAILSAPLMFLSGGRAEAMARKLAARLAELGHEVRVFIHDRSQALVGELRYPAMA